MTTPPPVSPAAPATTVAPRKRSRLRRFMALSALGATGLFVVLPLADAVLGTATKENFRAAANYVTQQATAVLDSGLNFMAAKFPPQFAPMTVANPATTALTPESEQEFTRLLVAISTSRCREGIELTGHTPDTVRGVEAIRISMDIAQRFADRVRSSTGLPANKLKAAGVGPAQPILNIPADQPYQYYVRARCLGVLPSPT